MTAQHSAKKSHLAKTRKRKFVVSIGIVLVILVAALLIQQRISYENGDKSFIFGQKLGYTQSQPLPLNGLSFSVQKVSSVAFMPYPLTNCPNSQQDQALTIRCLHTDAVRRAHNEIYQREAQYQINLSAQNNHNTAADLSNYTFSLTGNSTVIANKNIDIGDIRPGASKTFSIIIRVPRATKSLHLSIEDSNITKYFEITLD